MKKLTAVTRFHWGSLRNWGARTKIYYEEELVFQRIVGRKYSFNFKDTQLYVVDTTSFMQNFCSYSIQTANGEEVGTIVMRGRTLCLDLKTQNGHLSEDAVYKLNLNSFKDYFTKPIKGLLSFQGVNFILDPYKYEISMESGSNSIPKSAILVGCVWLYGCAQAVR